MAPPKLLLSAPGFPHFSGPCLSLTVSPFPAGSSSLLGLDQQMGGTLVPSYCNRKGFPRRIGLKLILPGGCRTTHDVPVLGINQKEAGS